MNPKLYVGNLPWAVDNQKLSDLFAQYGQITSATVISDSRTGRSKGFGFVEFATAEDAQKAASAMNGQEIEGRKLVVNEARPQKPREYNNRQ